MAAVCHQSLPQEIVTPSLPHCIFEDHVAVLQFEILYCKISATKTSHIKFISRTERKMRSLTFFKSENLYLARVFLDFGYEYQRIPTLSKLKIIESYIPLIKVSHFSLSIIKENIGFKILSRTWPLDHFSKNKDPFRTLKRNSRVPLDSILFSFSL